MMQVHFRVEFLACFSAVRITVPALSVLSFMLCTQLRPFFASTHLRLQSEPISCCLWLCFI